jgi:hypothetical protein
MPRLFLPVRRRAASHNNLIRTPGDSIAISQKQPYESIRLPSEIIDICAETGNDCNREAGKYRR